MKRTSPREKGEGQEGDASAKEIGDGSREAVVGTGELHSSAASSHFLSFPCVFLLSQVFFRLAAR